MPVKVIVRDQATGGWVGEVYDAAGVVHGEVDVQYTPAIAMPDGTVRRRRCFVTLKRLDGDTLDLELPVPPNTPIPAPGSLPEPINFFALIL